MAIYEATNTIKHPIVVGNYTVMTPMIIQLIKNVETWISKRTPGAIIYGAPRIGKTQAMKYITNYFTEKDNIPSYYYSAVGDSISSLSRFSTGLLFAVDHPSFSKGGNAQLKLLQIVQQITTDAAISEQNRVILVIDEAQHLVIQQYDWLITVYNELKARNVDLITLLVGQKELKTNRESYISMKQRQIVDRFMVDTFDFHGLRPKSDDISFLLNTYDNQTEFPSGSEITYTEHFFSQEFTLNTFRLADYADELYQAIQNVHDDYILGAIGKLPLNSFIPIVEYALIKFGEQGDNISELKVTHWKEALIETHYVSSRQLHV